MTKGTGGKGAYAAAKTASVKGRRWFTSAWTDRRLYLSALIDLVSVGAVWANALIFLAIVNRMSGALALMDANDYAALSASTMKIIWIVVLYLVLMLIIYSTSRFLLYRYLYRKWAGWIAFLKYLAVNAVSFVIAVAVLGAFGNATQALSDQQQLASAVLLVVVAWALVGYLLLFLTATDLSFFRDGRLWQAMKRGGRLSLHKAYYLITAPLGFLLFYGVLHSLFALLFFDQSNATISGIILFLDLAVFLLYVSWMRLLLLRRASA